MNKEETETQIFNFMGKYRILSTALAILVGIVIISFLYYGYDKFSGRDQTLLILFGGLGAIGWAFIRIFVEDGFF